VLAGKASVGFELEGMQDLAFELRRAGKLRHMRLGEIAVAIEQEPGDEQASIRMHVPEPGQRVEHRFGHPRIESDAGEDSAFLDDFPQIAMDALAAFQALRAQMGTKAVGILNEIRVGSRAVPALSPPDAADVLRRFEDHVAETPLLQIVARADAGHTGTDDDRFDHMRAICHDSTLLRPRTGGGRPTVIALPAELIRQP